MTYDQCIESAAAMLRENHANTTAMWFRIGAMIQQLLDTLQPPDKPVGHGIKAGQHSIAHVCQRLATGISRAGVACGRSSLYKAHHAAITLTHAEQQTMISRAVPMRDVDLICSRRYAPRRAELIADIAKRGRTKHLARRHYGLLQPRVHQDDYTPTPADTIVFDLPPTVEKWTMLFGNLLTRCNGSRAEVFAALVAGARQANCLEGLRNAIK